MARLQAQWQRVTAALAVARQADEPDSVRIEKLTRRVEALQTELQKLGVDPQVGGPQLMDPGDRASVRSDSNRWVPDRVRVGAVAEVIARGEMWRRWTSRRRVRVGGRPDRAWAADRAMVVGQVWVAGQVVEEQVGDGDGGRGYGRGAGGGGGRGRGM